jgi:hypothetical protein
MGYLAVSRYPNPTKAKLQLQTDIPVFGIFWLVKIVNYLSVRFLRNGMRLVNMKQKLKSQ